MSLRASLISLVTWSLALLALIAPLRPASADPISDARATLSDAEFLITQRLETRAELEHRFQGRIDLINRLKAERGALDPLGDRELRAALGDARAIAEQLNALTTQLNAARQETLAAQAALIGLYDQQLGALEQQLVRAPYDQQAPLLAQLNTLQLERARIRAIHPTLQAPFLPPIPQLASLSSSDPDELLAAVGELKDHEERLRGQLQAVEVRLAKLEKQRQIKHMADDFADEDATFSEDQTNIRLSTSRAAVTAGATGSPNPVGGGTVSNGGKVDGQGGSPTTPGRGVETDDATAGAAEGGSSSGGVGSSSGAGEPSAPANGTDQPPGFNTDSGAPDPVGGGDTPPTPNQDPVTTPLPDLTPTPTITADTIIRSDTDPNVILRGGASPSLSLSSQDELKALRSQRRQLLDHLRDVRAQEESLRQRAQELGDF
jgi:hypothetical protein